MAPGGPGARRARRGLRGRLVRLMAIRLVVAVATLGVSLWLIGVGEEPDTPAIRGLYATVAAAFAATVLFAAVLPFVGRLRALAAAQVAVDVALVTALVHCTGGADSIFTFLYVPVTLYSALLFGRPGAYAASVLAMTAFGGLLGLRVEGTLPSWGAPPRPGPVQLAIWGVHAGALLILSLLGSTLAREIDRADRALDQRTRDLMRLRRLHERTVESLTSGLLTVDPHGRIASFNAEAERITGVPAREAVGQPLDAVIPGALDVVLESCSGERPARLRARLPLRNRRGEDLHLGLAGSVLRDEDGSAAGHVVIFQDVTRIVDMERELRRRERLAAAGQLGASLAHEIRNPLAAISGSLQMLQGASGGGASDPESRRLMGIVVREADRLSDLIGDFLQYAGPAPVRVEPVDVGRVAAEVRDMAASSQPDGVALELDAAPGCRALVDAGQLRQLLWNLVRNAMEALEGKPGTVRIEVRAAGRSQAAPAGGRNGEQTGEGPARVEICVSDTGVGIPADVVDRIFEPFYTSKPEGTGLGLATVHRIVEDNGGELAVESAAGRGTTVRVWLPALEESA